MKLKITFGEEIRYDVPIRPMIQPWTQLLIGARFSMRSPVPSERPQPGWRGNGWKITIYP